MALRRRGDAGQFAPAQFFLFGHWASAGAAARKIASPTAIASHEPRFVEMCVIPSLLDAK